jgi:hypothetical protein
VIGNPAASLNQWSEDTMDVEAEPLVEKTKRSVLTRSGGPVCDAYTLSPCRYSPCNGVMLSKSFPPCYRMHSAKPFITDTGLMQVRLMGEADYMKHVTAEKSIYTPDERGVSGNETPQGTSSGTARARLRQKQSAKQEGSQADVSRNLKPFQKRQPNVEGVAATTSDEEADKLWGSQKTTDPEFFI